MPRIIKCLSLQITNSYLTNITISDGLLAASCILHQNWKSTFANITLLLAVRGFAISSFKEKLFSTFEVHQIFVFVLISFKVC